MVSYYYSYNNQCCTLQQTPPPGWGEFVPFLTHWGRVTHICVNKVTIIGSDNGLAPGRRQAIIWTNAGIFLIGPLGTNFSEILIEIDTFSLKKMRLKMSSATWRPFCLGLNVLSTVGGMFIALRWSHPWPNYICNRLEPIISVKWMPFCRRHFKKYFPKDFV